VKLDQFAHNIEPNSHPTDPLGVGVGRTVEALEDALLRLWRYANTAIGDCYKRFLSLY
jgi:hypothetical protein